MGAAQSKSKQQQDLQSRTDFSWDEIKHLHQRFRQLSGGRPTLRQDDFLHIANLQLNPIGSEITRAFFDKRNLRKGTGGLADEINFDDFLTIIGYFRPVDWAVGSGSEEVERLRKEKMKFLFHMFDGDFDGLITLDEYSNVVEELLYGGRRAQKEKDSVRLIARSIAQGAMREADAVSSRPKDASKEYPGISFEDFLKTWQGFDIAANMQVSFLNLETINH
uniref:calcineurin B homologous protein 3-like n=1 Tax=Jaculus jaculus TaxID=51337 RepID=UPI001E1B2A99|nr:calcineurin B homologous protein 3-like [Jaculus jaculus]